MNVEAKTGAIERLMPIGAVVGAIGVSRVTIYQWTKTGAFPAPIKLSERRIAWRESDVRRWIDSRPTPKAHQIEGEAV